jgi:hypothetical protein
VPFFTIKSQVDYYGFCRENKSPLSAAKDEGKAKKKKKVDKLKCRF